MNLWRTFVLLLLLSANAAAQTPQPSPSPQPDPTSVAVNQICGSSDFGNRTCDLVIKEVRNSLKKRIANVMSYYYDGTLVEFSMRSPVGMCKPGGYIDRVPCQVVAPTPELPSNHRNQACGSLTPNMAKTTPPDPLTCFGAYPNLSKKTCGSAMYDFAQDQYKMYQSIIDSLQKAITACKNNQTVAGHQCSMMGLPTIEVKLATYQCGIGITPSGGSCPSPSYPQSWITNLVNTWNDDVKNSAGYCMFTESSVEFETCTKEKSYLYGYRATLWQAYLEKVLSEIDPNNNGDGKGVIQLVQFGAGGAYPSAQLALDVLNGAAAINAQEAVVQGKFKDLNEWLNEKNIEGCIGVDQAENNCGKAYSDMTPEEALACAQKRIKVTETAVAGGAIQQRNKVISDAVCPLVLARMRMVGVFTKLATSEVMFRTDKAYNETYLSGDGILGRLANQVVQPCADYAQKSFDVFSCHESCMWGNFYSCYRGKVDGFFTSEIQSDMSSRGIQDRSPASDQKLLDPKNQKPVDVNAIPYCSALSLFPFFRRRRGVKRAKTKLSVKHTTVLVVALTLHLVFSFAGGCSGGAPSYSSGSSGGGCPQGETFDTSCASGASGSSGGCCSTDANGNCTTGAGSWVSDETTASAGCLTACCSTTTANCTPPVGTCSGGGGNDGKQFNDPAPDIKPSQELTSGGGAVQPKGGANGPGHGLGSSADTAANLPGDGGVGSLPGNSNGSSPGGPGSGASGAGSGSGLGSTTSAGSAGFGALGAGDGSAAGGGAGVGSDAATAGKLYTGANGPFDGTGSGGNTMGAARNIGSGGFGSDAITPSSNDKPYGEGYLKNNGDLSLFEIINRRYNTWGTELQRTGGFE